MYKIGDHGWDSEEEYLKFKKYLIPKLKKMFDLGYSAEWDFQGNWIKITKDLGRIDDHHTKLYGSAKVFRVSSTYGVDNGKISKFSIYRQPDYPNTAFNISKRKWYFSYDRGPDQKDLRYKEARMMYDRMIKVFN